MDNIFLCKKLFSGAVAVSMIFSSLTITPFSASALNGEGTSESPYVISCAEDLKMFRDKVNDGETSACAVLENDIVFNENVTFNLDNGTCSGNSPEIWTPVCEDEDNKYSGVFNGKGHTIKGLCAKTNSDKNQGLFGNCDNAVIKNVKIENSVISSQGSSGAVAGNAENTEISGCEVSAYVNGNVSGGILGKAADGVKVNNSFSSSTVKGEKAGGICGYSLVNVDFEKCGNTGDVGNSDTKNGGGIVGEVNFSSENSAAASVKEIYNTGKVTCSSFDGNAGGIVGGETYPLEYPYIDTETGEIDETYCQGYIEIHNGYNMGTLSGCYRGEAIGSVHEKDSSVNLKNFYYVKNNSAGAGYFAEDNTKKTTEEKFSNGYVAFELNNSGSKNDIWGQEIGKDKYPVIGGKKVYKGKNCQGSTVYANESVNSSHIYSENGKCSICGDFKDGISGLYGNSVDLDGTVNLNFIVELSGSARKTYTKMVFEIMETDPESGEEKVKETKEQFFSDATNETVDGVDYYKFTCRLAAKEMSLKVKAHIESLQKTGTVYSCSVKEYSAKLLNNDTTDDSTKNLVAALLNYGTAAENYFGYNTISPANSVLTHEEKIVSEVTADDLKAYAPKCTTNDKYTGNSTYYGSSLVLNWGTDMKHYFKVNPDSDISNYSCSDSWGNNIEIQKQGGYVFACVENIPAVKLATSVTVKFYENDVLAASVKYSPLSYAYSVLKSCNGETPKDVRSRNLAMNLYNLYEKAVSYKNSQSA